MIIVINNNLWITVNIDVKTDGICNHIAISTLIGKHHGISGLKGICSVPQRIPLTSIYLLVYWNGFISTTMVNGIWGIGGPI